MPEAKSIVHGLCLFSGSLDSQLAVRVLQKQGVCVHGVVFYSPFFDSSMARAAARELDIPLRYVDFSKVIVELLNRMWKEQSNEKQWLPCRACRLAMLRYAREVMEEEHFSCLVTGDVLDQCTPLQSRERLIQMDREAGLSGRILRPLSAQCLPETLMEERGVIDRSELLAWQGRCRKKAESLAQQYELTAYPGHTELCRMKETHFLERVKDALLHEGFSGSRTLALLHTGRHFRLGKSTKLIVGRDEKENATIEGAAELYDILLALDGIHGPKALVPFTATEEELALAASICARYGDGHAHKSTRVRLRSPRMSRCVDVFPASAERIEMYRI